ncbi:M66 family metalloprotease [Providencia sp.]|uniref:M66 family metalloprotease n=1 Tax=Providencia sp. TaxID=589 RepID=UPI003F95A457
MDNPSFPSSVQWNKEQKFGLQVQVYDMTSLDQTTPVIRQVIAVSDLTDNAALLKTRTTQSKWVYEGIITIPKNGKYSFMIDKHSSDLSIEINHKKIKLSTEEITNGLYFNNLNAGEQYPIKFTTITDGSVPQFRFYWDTENGYEYIPENLIHPPTRHSHNTKVQEIITNEVKQNNLQLGYYKKGRGRIAVLRHNSTLINALIKEDPTRSETGNTAFHLLSWLADKQRIPGGNQKIHLLSAVSIDELSGFQFKSKHGLFVDSFNSPHDWLEGDSRAANQMADPLLPSGQWYRHYEIVILPSNANDKQVKLARHYMALTGGGVLIHHNDDISSSKAIQELIQEIQPTQYEQEQATSPTAAHSKHGLHLTINELNPLTNTTTPVFKTVIPANSLQNNAHLLLSPRKTPTQWVYDGTITAPRDGFLILALEKYSPGLLQSYKVNHQDASIDKNQQLNTLKLNNLQANKKYPIQIIITNNGDIPKFQLMWDINGNTEQLSSQALHHHLTEVPYQKERIPIITEPSIPEVSYQKVISLPSPAISSLHLTEDMVTQAEYFSLSLQIDSHSKPFILNDIRLSPHNSWQSLVSEIENKVNQEIEPLFNTHISAKFKDNNITIQGDNLSILQLQLKKNKAINYVQIKSEYYKKHKFKSIKEHGYTKHIIHLKPENLNEITHFSLVLKGQETEQVQFIKTELRSPHLRETLPEQFVERLQNYLQSHAQSSSLVVSYHHGKKEEDQKLYIKDPLNRTIEDLNFGIQHQTLPFVIANNTGAETNKLTVGAVTDKLPSHKDIIEYRLLEAPKFGIVTLNNRTGEWQYQPKSDESFSGDDQFDFVAITENGQESAPMSIHIQSDRPPIVSYPGKRVFTIPDPIYHEPAKRNYSVPDDMKIQTIQLAQTHLQSPDTPYFILTANRWALLKVDITSQSAASAPNLTAIVIDKNDMELGRIRLTGPDKLPQKLPSIPNIPSVESKEVHKHSYTAPLKGHWVQPDIRIQLIAGDTPITMPYTDNNGFFKPKISVSNEMTSRITHHSLYQQGHGVYAYSPLSWGIEAAAKLPATKFTLYSYPTISQTMPLDPAITHHSALFMPAYDRVNGFYNNSTEQISWGFHRSHQSIGVNGLDSDFNYYALTPTNTINLLGLAWKNQGAGIARSDVMWHELYGHGFGLNHTINTDNTDNTEFFYPFDGKTNGQNIGYDQQTQSYITYRYTEPHSKESKEVMPALYPFLQNQGYDHFNAFTPHSDFFTQRIQQFLRKKLRWQPNNIIDHDIEDNNFAGEGYYQNWSEKEQKWVTLTLDNFSSFYPNTRHYELAHQRDVPVYWIQALIITTPDNQPHPYSTIQPLRTIGNLPAKYHNLKTGEGRPYHHHTPYALTVTYATKQGLLTESLQAIPYIETINLNIPDKGELVKIEIARINKNKQIGESIYTYKNSNSLANRLFSKWKSNSSLEQLVLDNYWSGSQLFWSATATDLIDLKTGKINLHRLTEDSAICAAWIENGQRHQQYFSLHDPLGEFTQVRTTQIFLPINHTNLLENNNIVPQDYYTESNVPLLSDVHINQTIDITALQLPENICNYWVTLTVEDKQGKQQEQNPLEQWQITRKGNKLSIIGTIDSTPALKINKIKIYIDEHLQDRVEPFSITLSQNYTSIISENMEFLDYNHPVVFNKIENQPELFSTMDKTDSQTIMGNKVYMPIASSAVSSPLLIV